MLSNQYPVHQVQQIIGATGDLVNPNDVISTLLTDSRRINNATEGLFFALNGRRNGHAFIAEAYAAGVRNFVVIDGPEVKLPEANFLVVPDVLDALQKLAAYHRSRFNLPL